MSDIKPTYVEVYEFMDSLSFDEKMTVWENLKGLLADEARELRYAREKEVASIDDCLKRLNQ